MTLRVIARGRNDPIVRTIGQDTWYCARTPEGPVTCLLRQIDDRTIDASFWGPGSTWQAERLPDLIGDGAQPGAPPRWDGALGDVQRRHVGLRIPRTERVVDAMVCAVLEQRVVGLDAAASRQRLLAHYGEVPPGPAPAGMRVPPAITVWVRIPSWDWHTAGVDPQRSRTIIGVATHAARVEESAGMDMADAYRRLQAVPGVGQWTAAETAKIALGDTDAVSFGDYHLGRFVTWALSGRHGGDDVSMGELLEPYRPFRQVVIRLLELTVRMPRRGPRTSRVDYRAI